MNRERFANLILLVDQIPLREYDQNTFGMVCESVSGKCGTVGCAAFHFAREFPEYGVAALKPKYGGQFEIRSERDDYRQDDPFGAMGYALEIGTFNAEFLFSGADEAETPGAQRRELKKRLTDFWLEQTGEKWTASVEHKKALKASERATARKAA